jgi:Domain of unknown function (DUF4399)
MNKMITCSLGVVLTCLSQLAWAQKDTPAHYALHPWQAVQPLAKTEAYFTNLPADGKVEMPFVLKFGLSGGWGLAPIAKPMGGKSGHHHLLVNTTLPLDISKPIAFSEKYVHFGKGQMETVLNLPPGKHTLRLLLADHEHKLHFVYSKEQTIVVTKKSTEIDPKSLVKKEVSLINISAGDTFNTPFLVQFHASGYNVAHMQQKEKDTGHFRLIVQPLKGGKPAEIAFTNGQTEAWLSPPAGGYKLKLELVSNEVADKVLATSEIVAVHVRDLPQ